MEDIRALENFANKLFETEFEQVKEVSSNRLPE